MKKIIFVFLIALTVASCGTAIKTLTGFKNPKVETKETVLEYFNENKLGDETYFLKVSQPSDTLAIYKNLILGISSEIMIFDKAKQQYCYNGTESCSGVQLKEAFSDFENKYLPCKEEENFMYVDFLEHLQDKEGKSLSFESLPEADFYFFVFWNKYMGSVKNIKENTSWIYELQNESNLKTKVILVNSDLLDEWGLEKGSELPVKFKKTKDGMSLDFGDLPISRD